MSIDSGPGNRFPVGVQPATGQPDPRTIHPQLSEAVEAFAGRFGRRPTLAAAAPGRVNLIGEHTDYNDGFVLPIAIDRETVIVADRAAENKSTLVATNLGREVQVDLTRPLEPFSQDHPRAFANSLLGVVSEFARRGGSIPNLDLLVMSTIPIGAGLSSSASVEVAMATLLEQVTGVVLDPMEKALLCQRAEHDFVGTPCGIMDMFISVFAGPDHALMIDCRTCEARPVPLPPADEMTLLVADTGVKRTLATGEYAQRRATCARAAETLGVKALRDATLSMIENAPERDLTETRRKRAAHVVLENVRTLLAAAALEQGDIAEFCRQMFASHHSLRDLYEVSCRELDLFVDAARELGSKTGDDHLGARMTGGGFGGCAIIFCRTAAAQHVAEILGSRFEAEFDHRPDIFAVRASAGARRITLARGNHAP